MATLREIARQHGNYAQELFKEEELYGYFEHNVLETKGNIQIGMLRPAENDKIYCGMKLFEALENGVTYQSVDDFDKFIENM